MRQIFVCLIFVVMATDENVLKEKISQSMVFHDNNIYITETGTDEHRVFIITGEVSH